MAKLILHTIPDPDQITERRLLENFALTKRERMKKAYLLMAISSRLKNGVLKEPEALGIVLTRR